MSTSLYWLLPKPAAKVLRLPPASSSKGFLPAALVVAAWLLGATPGRSQNYVPPQNNRVDLVLDSGWRFIRQDVSGAQYIGFDDSSWTAISLPHTWNNLDGQDGGNNYYRGIGWYRAHFTLDSRYVGRHVFLKFDGAFLVTDVYVNGAYLGEHQGGFADFVFDLTPFLVTGGDNVIAVKVSNASNANIPPLSADFTFFGGLYRDVHLLVTDPVHISPLDYGSPGLYLQPTNVSASAANLQVTTLVSNSTASSATVTVRAVITDAASNIVAALTNIVTLPPMSLSNVVANTTLANPHLWNGLSDPYLYQAYVELWNGASAVDVVAQPLGFRYFRVDPTNGFFLNGRPYDLHGVSMHQDWLNCGWALTNAQRQTNFQLLKELGATAIRLSHYEHNEETYQLADQAGIVLWSEIPLINSITDVSAFYTNAQQQLLELIRQRGNHPAVVCWGVFNEITSSGQNPTNLINQLVQTAAQQDPTRLTTAASNSGDNSPTTQYPQLIAYNKYYGWYSGTVNDFATWADNIHASEPKRTIGVSEYGAGASIYQHSENPVTEPANAGPYHPEEYQNLFHEAHWQAMKARPFLWCKFIWNLCDFAVDSRNEGDTAGRNDKGLVTYDRQVRKDAFFWYKANWTTNPMVYITGHTFTNRTNQITAKVYANCDSVELFLNGASQGSVSSTNCIFNWPLALLPGTNTVQAIGTKGNVQVNDSLVWITPIPLPNVAIVSPSAPTIYLATASSPLQLSATASQNPLNPQGSLPVSWSQIAGPSTITFGDTHVLNTTVQLGADGVYQILFQAGSGSAVASTTLTVIVGNVPYGPTLRARFAFDDAGPGTNTPSDTSSGGISASLQMVDKNGAAANYHGAARSGVAGLTTGSRALDFTVNTGQGGSGPLAATTNAALGFGTVTNFAVTMWFKQTVGLANTIGPRMFVLGNSTNSDCGTSNSIGMKFQDAGHLYFFVNALQATATYTNNVPTNSWVFVAMVYDGTNVMLYSGSDLTSATLMSTTPATGQPVLLGGAASLDIGNRLGRDRDFAGWIDDFRFYTGAGDWSFIESVRQAAAGPAGLAALPGNNQVLLLWSPLAGATSYNLKRSAVSGGPYTTLSSAGAVTGTSFTDGTALNGLTYYYTLSAATQITRSPETANSPIEASAVGGCVSVPAPTVAYNSPLYQGMALRLTASAIPGATYAWTGPNGFISTNQNPILVNATQNASGTYSVIATVAGCSSAPGLAQVTVNPPVRLSVQPAAASIIFTWPYGALQSATNLAGPWTDLGAATAPYTSAPALPRQFYRVRLQ